MRKFLIVTAILALVITSCDGKKSNNDSDFQDTDILNDDVLTDTDYSDYDTVPIDAEIDIDTDETFQNDADSEYPDGNDDQSADEDDDRVFVDLCIGNPCKDELNSTGKCINQVNTYKCECYSGYHWVDGACETVPGRLYVKADATGKNDGISWEDAYTDLQDAIDVAEAYGEVWVAAGTYKPSRIVQSMTPIPQPEDPDYKRYNHFSLKSNLTVLGGFSGTETSINQRNWDTNKTILSGDLDGSGGLSNGDAYHVMLNVNIGDTAVLDGFTITGGNANSTYQSVTDVHMWHGGGMNNRNFASPTIKNCIFEGNNALINGGGIADLNSSPLISDCEFLNNSAARGGGIANSTSSPRVTRTLFKNNSSFEGYGGAVINADKSRGTFLECTFEHNTSQDAGAIANNVNSNITVDHCTFINNSAEKNGGAITNAQSSPVIRNSIFDGNEAKVNGGAIENHDDSSPIIIYSLFKNNSITDFGDGGAILTNSGVPLIISSIFYGNSAYNGGAVANRDTKIMILSSTFYGNTATGESGYGGGIYNESNAAPEIINSILWDNLSTNEGSEIYNQFASPHISFSNIQGAFPGGEWDDTFGENYGDNISEDPKFNDTELDDFSLELGSPCIDTGSNAPFETGGLATSFQQDYDGNLRIINEITDIGAVEFVQ